MQDGNHYRNPIFAGNFLLRGSCVAMAGEICVATRALMVLFYLSMLGGEGGFLTSWPKCAGWAWGSSRNSSTSSYLTSLL